MADCTFESGDCFEVTGDCDAGLSVDPIVDPDSENVFTCGADGMGVIPPDTLLYPPRAMAIKTGGQNSTTATELTVNLDDTEYNDGLPTPPWDIADPSKAFARADGLFMSLAQVVFDENATGYRKTSVYFNGTKDIGSMQVQACAADGVTSISVPTLWIMDAAEYVQLRAKQNSGVTLEVLNMDKISPNLTLVRIGDGV